MSQPWVATISVSFCFAVALFHMLGVSAMIVMSGNSANTALAAEFRRRSTMLPGIPPMKTIFPLPPSSSASHSAGPAPAQS